MSGTPAATRAQGCLLFIHPGAGLGNKVVLLLLFYFYLTETEGEGHSSQLLSSRSMHGQFSFFFPYSEKKPITSIALCRISSIYLYHILHNTYIIYIIIRCPAFKNRLFLKTTFKQMENESSIPCVMMMYLVCAPSVSKQQMASLRNWLP